jgi:hypothetical protein
MMKTFNVLYITQYFSLCTFYNTFVNVKVLLKFVNSFLVHKMFIYLYSDNNK